MEIFFLSSSAQYFSGTPSFLSCSIFCCLIFSNFFLSAAIWARTTLPSSRKSRRSCRDRSSLAAIWLRISTECCLRIVSSSSARFLSACSCCMCTSMIRSNSSLSNLACSAKRRSFSACCCFRACNNSALMASWRFFSWRSFSRAVRSAASMARFALRASISAALSWAFSCIARNSAVSLSFAAAAANFSSSSCLSRTSRFC
mmetsp:Transcript_27245/g.65627  ORF Transcript_27245/g.65627 Transcript_27245/m.65627 type:complete len:202 (+) Transcript_27245:192-797(+)